MGGDSAEAAGVAGADLRSLRNGAAKRPAEAGQDGAGVFEAVLPDAEDGPAGGAKLPCHLSVAGAIAGNLGVPEGLF